MTTHTDPAARVSHLRHHSTYASAKWAKATIESITGRPQKIVTSAARRQFSVVNAR